MLDVACGKGRHSKALADMGFSVVGIDISEASIEEANKNANETLQFFQHDMRLPFHINYFDFAFNFFTSFGYFKTQREHNNAIRTIVQSVKKDGIVVIDYLNVQYISDRLEKTNEHLVEGIQFQITKWQDETHFYKQIQVSEPEKFAPKHLFTEKVAKFNLGDFTEMLALHNVQVQEVFGDYSLGSYHVKKSPRLIIVGKKVR